LSVKHCFNGNLTRIVDEKRMKIMQIRANTESWINLVFKADAAGKGGVVRRNVTWVEREVGRHRLIIEVKRRGYHMVESGGQFVIFCNSGAVKVIC
jgi:hypothetical protein